MKNYVQLNIDNMKKNLEELGNLKISIASYPEVVQAAIKNYRRDLNSAITDMKNQINEEI